MEREEAAVVVIDPATGANTTPIPVERFPTSVAVTPDGKQALVTNFSDDSVVIVDL